METAQNQFSRDFQRRPIFDFCNSICQLQTLHLALDDLVCTSERGLTLAIRLSENPQSAASHLIARPERYTKRL